MGNTKMDVGFGSKAVRLRPSRCLPLHLWKLTYRATTCGPCPCARVDTVVWRRSSASICRAAGGRVEGTRYTTSGFLRIKLGEALERRCVAQDNVGRRLCHVRGAVNGDADIRGMQ